jgi:hypothetical protein
MRGHGPRGYAYPRAGARGVMWLPTPSEGVVAFPSSEIFTSVKKNRGNALPCLLVFGDDDLTFSRLSRRRSETARGEVNVSRFTRNTKTLPWLP